MPHAICMVFNILTQYPLPPPPGTPLRDCINGVYGCSDMTECVPNFEFAPQRTFTIGDAARAARYDPVLTLCAHPVPTLCADPVC